GLESLGEELEAAHYRLVLGRCRWEQSRPDAAHEETEHARRVLEKHGPSAELAVAYVRLAGLYKFEFDEARSIDMATKAVEVATAAGADFERVWAKSWLAFALLDSGPTAEAMEMLDECFDEALRSGTRSSPTTSRTTKPGRGCTRWRRASATASPHSSP